jgi:hypothetical protein
VTGRRPAHRALKDRYGPVDQGVDALARDVAAVLSVDD